MSERIPDDVWPDVKARCTTGLETMLALEAERARRVETEQVEIINDMVALLRMVLAKYEPVLNAGHERQIKEVLERCGVVP